MSTNTHRGPVKGYNSREKQAYRKSVWSSMGEAISIANNSQDKDPHYILMLPGLSTKEIDTAIRFGLRKDRIILVHESATHIEAEAEWRTKYPEIKYYSGILSSLFDKFKEDKIKFSGANLDFCGNFSSETIDEYSAFCDYYSKNQSDSIPLTVGVTVTKGRETPSMVRLLEKLHTRNEPVGLSEKRLEVLVREFGCEIKEEKLDIPYTKKNKKTEVNVLVEGAYVHNKAPMAYCVVEYKHPRAYLNTLKNKCNEEATNVLKQISKIKIDKNISSYFGIKSKQEFLNYIEKRGLLLQQVQKLFGRDTTCNNLNTWFRLSDGTRTKAKTVHRTFYSREESINLEIKMAKYSIDISNGLDFFLSTEKEPVWCDETNSVRFKTNRSW